MIEKEFLDKLPDPNNFNRNFKVLRIYRKDGVFGYRTFQRYKTRNEKGDEFYFWDNPVQF